MKYNNYGLTAIEAVRTISEFSSPKEAWEAACKNYFHSISSQNKSCPRDAFLGLCKEGLIKGIMKGNYTRSKLNKSYAVKALKVLQENKNEVYSVRELWAKLKLEGKSHNSQLDVVLALWNNNLII
ncbi:DUF6979 family protein [Mesoflavibacter zeaxanthinifaciens]|uniref:DUF6979 family protein n=1 Tax=Mesoflavibacter zeaxanthinifaciens TaxID=393060 RepID=UPI003A95AF0F